MTERNWSLGGSQHDYLESEEQKQSFGRRAGKWADIILTQNLMTNRVSSETDTLRPRKRQGAHTIGRTTYNRNSENRGCPISSGSKTSTSEMSLAWTLTQAVADAMFHNLGLTWRQGRHWSHRRELPPLGTSPWTSELASEASFSSSHLCALLPPNTVPLQSSLSQDMWASQESFQIWGRSQEPITLYGTRGFVFQFFV
jgi:hypothetical protein